MLITFSKQYVAKDLLTADLGRLVECVVDAISVSNYGLTWQSDSPIGNLVPSITWSKSRRVRFTIETRDAFKHGSRTSAVGRHMRKASWEAHRDVMQALFAIDPQATIKTALATYKGKQGFEHDFPATAHHNVGSRMEPRTMLECSI